jgi:hypothetical protein
MLIDALAFFQLEEGYNLSDLKDTYRRLAKQYHPDLTGNQEEDNQRFIRIRSYYDTLLHHLDPSVPSQERLRYATQDKTQKPPRPHEAKVNAQEQNASPRGDATFFERNGSKQSGQGEIRITDEDKLWNKGRRFYEKYLDMMIHTFYVYSRINYLPDSRKVRLSPEDEEDIVQQYKYLLNAISIFSQFKKRYPHSPYSEEVEISLSSMKKVLAGSINTLRKVESIRKKLML